MSIVIGESADYRKSTYMKIKEEIKYYFIKKEKCTLLEEDFIGNIQIVGSSGSGKSMFSFDILENEIGLYNQLALLDEYDARVFISNLKKDLKSKIKVIYFKNKKSIIETINELKKDKNKLIMLVFNNNINFLEFEKEIKELIDKIEKNKKESLLKIYLLRYTCSKSMINLIKKNIMKSKCMNISYIILSYDLLDLDLFKTKIIFKTYDPEFVYKLRVFINQRDIISLNMGEFILIKNYNKVNFLNKRYWINKMYYKERNQKKEDLDSLEVFDLKQKIDDF